MKRLLTIILVGVFAVSSAYAVTPAAASNKKSVVVPPASKVLVPKNIKLNGQMIPSDTIARFKFEDMTALQDKYNSEEVTLRAKYKPEVNILSTKIEKEISEIRKANGWGTDVSYDPAKRQWFKDTTVKNAKDATAKPNLVPVTPKVMTVTGKEYPGDALIRIWFDDISVIQGRYNVEEKTLQDKYTPGFNEAVKKYMDAVKELRKVNGWSDDVVFDPQKKQWVHSTPPVATK
jgi:hypothetical protein